MRAAQTTRRGDPKVLEVVDLPEPDAGDDQKLSDVSTAACSRPTSTRPCPAT